MPNQHNYVRRSGGGGKPSECNGLPVLLNASIWMTMRHGIGKVEYEITNTNSRDDRHIFVIRK